MLDKKNPFLNFKIQCLLFSLSIFSLHTPSVARQIIMTLYTVQNGSLKMTAQIDSAEALGMTNRKAHLDLFINNSWVAGDTGKAMSMPGWTYHFRVNKWDDTRDVPYRVRFDTGSWQGIARKDPKSQNVITVATISCISPDAANGGNLPVDDIIRNIKAQGVDLLAFTGDQVYDHTTHTAAWRKFAYKFAELTKDIPATVQTDDHDVGTPNLWGSGGKLSTDPEGTDGGYYQPVSYVNMVNRVQTWHLPDVYDPTPIQRGISVYYTSMVWGEIGFAILEDRKWKSGPKEILTTAPGGTRWDWVTDPAFDFKKLDAPGAVLLGERQHLFIRNWAADWKGTQMKCVLTQTPLAGLATSHGTKTNGLIADLDANGWPQSQRNRALADIRRGFAITIAGDQHLTTLTQMGAEDWRDAGWVFTAPAVSNHYQRWWLPKSVGLNRTVGQGPEYGDHLDGFGNRITMLAFANPGVLQGNPAVLIDKSTGYGILKFDKQKRTTTIEAWPREIDVTQAGAKPYAGYPLTVTQEDQYGRKAVEYLPTINVTGMVNPIVQVIDPSAGADSIIYTLRINGNSFRPKVFKSGTYTIRTCEVGTSNEQVRMSVQSLPVAQSSSINISCATLSNTKDNVVKIDVKKITAEYNPASGTIVINNPEWGSFKAEVVNTQGKIIHSRSMEGPGKFFLSLPHGFQGAYFINLKSSKWNKSFPIRTEKIGN